MSAGLAPALFLVAVGLCALAVALAAAGSTADRLDRVLIEALIVAVPLGVGLYAIRSPHNVGFGLMLIGAGGLWSLTALAETSDSLPYSFGRVTAWLIFPVLMYLTLAFPDGRLRPGVDRTLYGGLIFVVAVLFIGSAPFVEAYPEQTPWATCTTDCPPNAFFVLGAEPAVLASVVAPLREALGSIVMGAIAVSLVRRWRTTTPLQRRTIGPVVVMSVAFAGILVSYFVARRVEPGAGAVDTLGRLWSLCVPGIALAFLLGLMQRRLVIGEVVGRLSAALGGNADRRQMRTALAAALRDPAADVLIPADEPGRWRSSDGSVVTRSGMQQGRALTPLLDGGAPIAALVHDPALREDDELLEPVGALMRAALRHELLTTRLARSLGQLDDSRKRIARAADVERSRIERDLHDGAQQRLIMLRIKLSIAEELLRDDPASGVEAVHELGVYVDLALEELRSLAHGVYPSVLSDRGVADALRSALAGAPLVAHLKVRDLTRQPREVETAVYFVCVEAIQNAAKHAAGATGVWINVRQDYALRFEIRDDGPGFVVADGDRNGGLSNMRDRLEAIGGRLTIDSIPGEGTSVRGVVPLT